MKRKIFKIYLILATLLLSLVFTSCKKNTPVEESFPEIVNKLSSYKLTGRLESTYPSGTKECNITTYFKAPNMYRVELQNPNSVESQVIIKNDNGVFVLVPSVNKTFKVNSSWPTTSSYPYLLQSISNDIISDTNMITTKEGNNTCLELKARMYHNDTKTSQKIIFDENKMPKEVLMYDENQKLINRFVVNSIEENCSIDDSIFKETESLNVLFEYFKDTVDEFERMVSYPTYYPVNTSLKEEKITGTTINTLAVMKFSGSSSYTIIEQFVNKTDTNIVEYVNGDIYVMSGVCVFVNDNNISFYNEGIQYTLASNDVDTLEMIKMADSLKTTDIK